MPRASPHRRPGDPGFTNATVSVSRNGAPVAGMQHIAVYIKKAGPMNLAFDGVQATTDLLSGTGPPGNPDMWRVNDIMTVHSDGLFQLSEYTVASAEPPRGLLPNWRIQVRSAIR